MGRSRLLVDAMADGDEQEVVADVMEGEREGLSALAAATAVATVAGGSGVSMKRSQLISPTLPLSVVVSVMVVVVGKSCDPCVPKLAIE